MAYDPKINAFKLAATLAEVWHDENPEMIGLLFSAAVKHVAEQKGLPPNFIVDVLAAAVCDPLNTIIKNTGDILRAADVAGEIAGAALSKAGAMHEARQARGQRS